MMLWLMNIGIRFAGFLQKFKNARWVVGTFLVLFLGSFASAWQYTSGIYTSLDTCLAKIFDTAYYTIRLFTISANDIEHFLDYPGLAFFAFLDTAFLFIAVAMAFAEGTARAALGLAIPKKDHVIVLGAGEWGLHYARPLVESDRNVVIIDANPSDNAYEEVISRRLDNKCQGDGSLFLVKAHFDEHSHDKLLEKVNAGSSKKIITMFNGDEANVDAAYALKSSKEVKGGVNPPTIMLPVDNIRLSASLAVYNRFSEFEESVEVRSFNIMQQAAVRHFQEHPPELYADIFGQKDIHFAIYGLGDVAINLIYVIGQLCHYRTWDMDCEEPKNEVKKVRVTVLDQDVEKATNELKFLFPNLHQVLDVEILPCASTNGISSHDYFLPQGEKDSENIPPITQHFLCFKDEMLSIRCAIKLRKQQMKHEGLNTPIFVRSQNGKGLTRLIESSCNKPEWPDNIFPYVILSNKLDDDIYFSDEIEHIAKSFNDWKVEKKDNNLFLDEKEKGEQWHKISAAFKHSSFFQAAYLKIRLRSVGYDWVKGSTKSDVEKIEEDIIQHLALLEHQRYKGERWMMGWNKGSRSLGDISKAHPELEDLSSNEKWVVSYYKEQVKKDGYDVKQARMLPSYLEKAGCCLVQQSVKSGKASLGEHDIYMFNMLSHEARTSAESALEDKKCGQVIGLLPLPFEVIKALFPLAGGASKCSDYLGKCFSLNETTKEKNGWVEDTLKSIAELSGKVDLYIEMPVKHSFDKWLKDEKDKPSKIEINLSWLEEACKQTDEYIDCRTGKGGKRSSTFLPKPSLKGEKND